jgi:hypothetical protein
MPAPYVREFVTDHKIKLETAQVLAKVMG